MEKSKKVTLLVCFITSSQIAALILWKYLPADTLLKSVGIVFGALAMWLMTTAITFAMFWSFFRLVVAAGQYVWDRFYRTPTL